MDKKIKQILESGDSSLYTSGSKASGTTFEEEIKTVKENMRKTKHQPTYFVDNADRDLLKKLKRFSSPPPSKKE